MVAYASPTQNKLKMPGAYDPAPGPIPDASAAAYVPGKTAPAPAPKANALAAKASPTMGSPYMQPKAPPRNALVADTIDGFMRGFNPEQFQVDQDRRRMEGQDKAKQTLALMQQQRALPTEQRGQWWMQNAPVISEIIGQDVGSMQVDDAQFSDQALDGHIAALSAQMGMAPEKAEFLNLGGGAVGKVQNGQFSMEQEAPKELKPTDPADYVETTLADGVYFVNKNDPKDKIKLGAAPRKAGEGPIDPNAPPDPERIRLEREYAKSWDAVRNNYSDVRGQYERLKSMGNLAATDPASRSAADLALIVSFTKMLDPGSVAREGEVKLTQSAASLYDTVRNLPNQWINGQTTIPDATRRALLKAADEMMPSYDAAYERLANDIGSTADAYGFPRDRVMMGYRPPAPPPPPPPTFMDAAGKFVGDMLNGFGGQQPGRPAPPQMRQPAPRQQAVDLSQLSDEEIDAMIAQGGGR